MKKDRAENINLSSFIIVATFFSLWVAVFFEPAIEDFLAYFLILTFGILHGANDIKLLQKTNVVINTKIGFVTTLVYYILFVGTSILFFFYLPSIALGLFIIFSGYHFGEQHWISKITGQSFFNLVLFLVYGLFVLFLIFNAHAIEVSAIINEISGRNIPLNYYGYALKFFGTVTVLMVAFGYFKKTLLFNFPKQAFYILVLYIVFHTASLLWAFAIYFILWHSIPSMVDQIKYLYGNLRLTSVRRYVLSSLPYWTISVLGIGIILFLFRAEVNTSLALFFSFLAAITFPHVLVITRLNRK